MSAENTTEPAILTRARARMAAHLAKFPQKAEVFAGYTPEQREKEVQMQARCAAIYNAPVGRAALRVGEAANELASALQDLLEAFPDRSAFKLAVSRAIKDAGLPHPPDDTLYYGTDCFAHLDDEARGWVFMVQLMIETMTDVWPDHVEGPDEDATGDAQRAVA